MGDEFSGRGDSLVGLGKVSSGFLHSPDTTLPTLGSLPSSSISKPTFYPPNTYASPHTPPKTTFMKPERSPNSPPTHPNSFVVSVYHPYLTYVWYVWFVWCLGDLTDGRLRWPRRGSFYLRGCIEKDEIKLKSGFHVVFRWRCGLGQRCGQPLPHCSRHFTVWHKGARPLPPTPHVHNYKHACARVRAHH